MNRPVAVGCKLQILYSSAMDS